MTIATPIKSGLTAADVPAEISDTAARPLCDCETPGPQSVPGFGYAGGGFGPYRVCDGCGSVFGKRSMRDGSAGSAAA